jgi:hypothetical protein
MALKVSGTTVIDDSKNIISGTPSVQGTIVTANVLTAPSGTTANRPGSPNTGHIYFDTDLGTLVTYNGTEWV